jgi:hypothetical protein
MIRAVLLVVLAGCSASKSRGDGSASAPPPPADAAPNACEREFWPRVPLAEASGAVAMTVDGREVVMVIGDSGRNGAYVLVDAGTGDVVEMGALPLGDGAGDDLEGLTRDGERVLAVTSAGYMRVWTRVTGGFQLVDGPYAIGDGPMTCDPFQVNCGKNYEGLCTTPKGPCDGWVASKADGHLYCLTREGDRFRVHHHRKVKITHDGALTGCDAAADGSVWLSTNAFDGAIYRVTWAGEEATVTSVEAPLGAFPEAIAVEPDGSLLRFSDLSMGESPMEHLRCR